jgi:hypothetical protein
LKSASVFISFMTQRAMIEPTRIISSPVVARYSA